MTVQPHEKPAERGQPLEKLWVGVAAQAVAAGLIGDRIKVTVVLSPVAAQAPSPQPQAPAGAQLVDLIHWPDEALKWIESRRLAVAPLRSDHQRGSVPAFRQVGASMSPVATAREEWLASAWLQINGDVAGLKQLHRWLETNLPPPPGAAPSAAPRLPEVHGAGRGEAALALNLETARHILDRLAGRAPAETRAEPRQSLAEIAYAILTFGARPGDLVVPGSTAKNAITAGEIVTKLGAEVADAGARKRNFDELWGRYEDEVAWMALQASRDRSTKEQARRTEYLRFATARAALDHLLKPLPAGTGGRDPNELAKGMAEKAEAGEQHDVPLDASHAARRLSSVDEPPNGLAPDDREAQMAASRFASLQHDPSLSRLFRLTVDVELPLGALDDALRGAHWVSDEAVIDYDDRPDSPDRLPPAAPADAAYMFLSADPGATPAIWTIAKLRRPEEGRAGHFYPCLREEVDAAVVGETVSVVRRICGQVDGVVNLGQRLATESGIVPRFDIVSLDTSSALGSDRQTERQRSQLRLAALREGGNRPKPDDEDGGPMRATRRTGGLILLDRWRQGEIVDRLATAAVREPGPGKPVILDAFDLTVGFRLDVGLHVKGGARRRWRSLMNRKLVYDPGGKLTRTSRSSGPNVFDRAITARYPAGLNPAGGRLHADAGILSPSEAVRPPSEPTGTRSVDAIFGEETVAIWEGDPLGASCRVDRRQRHADELQVGLKIDLPRTEDGDAYLPPPLRFGWRYTYGLRVVWSGGVSVPLERALGHYERSRRGQLTLPPCGDEAVGRSFRRHERISAPEVAIPESHFGARARPNETVVRLPYRFGPEQGRTMIVRTVADPANKALLGADRVASEGRPYARRILFPPSVNLAFAALHDAFRGAPVEQPSPRAEPTVYRDAVAKPGRDEALTFAEAVDAKGHRQTSSVVWAKVSGSARPVGGLKGVDRHAAWGGFPLFVRSDDSDTGRILTHQETAADRIPRDFPPVWDPVAGPPAGDAVFRLRSSHGQSALEREPYYPDPAAAALVVSVKVAGRPDAQIVVPFYADEPARIAPASYPDIMPVVLDLVRGDGRRPLIAFKDGDARASWVYADGDTFQRGSSRPRPERGRPLLVRHVLVSLGPGETAKVEAWCLPFSKFLRHASEPIESMAALCLSAGEEETRFPRNALRTFRKGFATPRQRDDAARTGLSVLGACPASSAMPGYPCGTTSGGLPLPSQAMLDDLSDYVAATMRQRPIPELASTLLLTATHAVDLPMREPELRTWTDAKGRPGHLLRRVTKDGLKAILDAHGPTGPADPAGWGIEDTAEPEGTEFVDLVMSGVVGVHGPSTGSLEIIASGAAAARGRFDDTERGRTPDDRARGRWPRFSESSALPRRDDGSGLPLDYVEPRDVFGFKVAPDGKVELLAESTTVLRIEGFGPQLDSIDLLAAQQRESGPDSPGATALRFHAFLDGRARWLGLQAIAVSRHAGLLRTRYDEVIEEQRSTGNVLTTWLPAAVRPARLSPLSVIPSFRWSPPAAAILTSTVLRKVKVVSASVSTTRTPLLRVRLNRPWFSSGEGERLGIVLWPPNLFSVDPNSVKNNELPDLQPGRAKLNVTTLPDDGGAIAELQDADLGPGGAFVTRRGADPIRSGPQPTGWLMSSDEFPQWRHATDDGSGRAAWDASPDEAPPDGTVVQGVLMPLPVDGDGASERASMSVSLLTFQPRFDLDEELWYADVEIAPSDTPYPFVRLGLVRFQPHAPRRLQVSEPVVEWAQVMPCRTATATVSRRAGSHQVTITVTVKGPAPMDAPRVGPSIRKRARAPDLSVWLLRETPGGGDAIADRKSASSDQHESGLMVWTAEFHDVVVNNDAPSSGRLSVYVEEIDLFRPARYPDEPRFDTRSDDVFVGTGPRFAAKLQLVVPA